MRVTDKMLFDMANNNVAGTRDRVRIAMQEASSGQRVVRPGDDPASAGLIVRGRQTISRLNAISTTAGRTIDELSVTDAALQTLGNILARTRELTVQMSNDGYSPSDRLVASTELDSLTRQVTLVLNTEVNGRYLFGGTNDNDPPFDPSGTYGGDTNTRQVEIAPGLLEDTSIRADVMVKGVGGGVDWYTVLQSLKTAMENNDGNGIRGALPDLDTATRQLTNAMADVGSMANSFDVGKTIADAGKVDATKTLALEQEVDTFQSATKLALANHALEVALSAASNGFRMSLLNKLS